MPTVKTHLLRYFIFIYGNFYLNFYPKSTRKNKTYFKVFNNFSYRQAYHFLVYAYFFWLYMHILKSLTQISFNFSRKKPILRIIIYFLQYINNFQHAIVFFYTLMIGPKIIQLLDKYAVFYNQILNKQKSVLLVAICLTFDFVIFVVYRFKDMQLFYLHFKKISIFIKLFFINEFICHCLATAYVRLLLYGKWATLNFLKNQINNNNPLSQTELQNLVKLNSQLNRLFSLPMFSYLFTISLISFSLFLFNNNFHHTMRQLLNLFPHVLNIILIDIFSKKILYFLKILASKIINLNLSRTKTKFSIVTTKTFIKQQIFWQYVVIMYQEVFQCSVFSLFTLNLQFFLQLFLIMVNYALVIIQTTTVD